MPKPHPPAAAVNMPRERIKLHLPKAPIELVGHGVLLLIVIAGLTFKSVIFGGAGQS